MGEKCAHEWKIEDQMSENSILCKCEHCGLEDQFITGTDFDIVEAE